MTPLDDALAGVWQAREHAEAALDILEKRGDQREAADELRQIVGSLYGIATSWEMERDRWR